MLYKKEKLLLLIIALLLVINLNLVSADMQSATPQASTFNYIDSGSAASGGDLGFDIPLFNLQGRSGQSIPVSLVYSSSDNNVYKESTEVGYGFNLGSLSMITRSVNGVPDDYKDIRYRRDKNCDGNIIDYRETGYLFYEDSNPLTYSEKTIPFSALCPSGEGYSELLGVQNGNPDNFYVSLNGESVGMVLDSNNIFRLANVRPWKISYTYDTSGINGISEFKITTEDGTTYVFKDLGLTTSNSMSVCERDLDVGTACSVYSCASGCNYNTQETYKPYTYAWPLVAVLNNNYKDTNSNGYPDSGDYGNWVKFNYIILGDTTSTNSYSYALNYLATSNTVPDNFFYDAKIRSTSTIKNFYLEYIRTPTYQADFSYSPRTNSYDTSKPNLMKLDYVYLRQNPEVIAAAPILKKFVLSYYPAAEAIYGFSYAGTVKKLTLKSIQEYGKTDSLFIPPTKFSYNIPASCTDYNINNYGLCDNSLDAFLIKSVEYPTGGKTEYLFEPDLVSYLQDINVAGNEKLANSGTRLKQISYYDGLGTITTKKFEYGLGVISQSPFCSKIYGYSGYSVYCPPLTSSEYQFDISDIGKSALNNVIYQRIKSWTDPINDNGFVMDYYTTPRDYPNICDADNKHCMTSLSYKIGLPIKSQYYGYNPSQSSFYLSKEIFREYSLDSLDASPNKEYSSWSDSGVYKVNMLDWSHFNQEPFGDIYKGAPDSEDIYAFTSSGSFITKEQVIDDYKLTSVVDYIYSDYDIPGYSLHLSNGLPGTNFNGQPKIVREHLLDFSCRSKVSTLPSIFGQVAYYQCQPIKVKESTSEYAFKTNSLLSQRNLLVLPGTNSVGERLYNYAPCVSCEGGYVLTSSSLKTESVAKNNYATNLNPSDSNQIYLESSSSWNDINKDSVLNSNELITTNYLQYDSYGNLLKSQSPPDPNGQRTTSEFKYDPLFKSNLIKTWNSVLGSEQNPILENEYDSFGNLKISRDINGRLTEYNYDNLGRLESVKKPLDNTPSTNYNYYYASNSLSNNNLNYVETNKILNPNTGLSMSAREFVDGQGKLIQSAVIESSTSTIRKNQEYYSNGLLKTSYQPFRDQGTLTSGSLNILATSESTVYSEPPMTKSTKDYSIKTKVGVEEDSGDIPARLPNEGCDPNIENCNSGTANVDKGHLYITSNPSNAAVYVDNLYKGLTPITASYLPAGSRLVRFEKPNYFTTSIICSVIPNLVSNCVGSLTGYGSAYITSVPEGANVYINDNFLGITPLSLTQLTTGSHNLKLTYDNYYDYLDTLTISTGQTTSKLLTLTQLPPGSISITTNPSDASIYLDSDPISKGTSPITITNVNVGNHQIKTIKEGYYESNQQVTVYSNQVSSISINLVPAGNSTKFNYTLDPLKRLSSTINPDKTFVTNDYSYEEEPITLNTCGYKNIRICTASSSTQYNTGNMAATQEYCNQICNSYISANTCTYSCNGVSNGLCEGQSASGSMTCTELSNAQPINSNTCSCTFGADGPNYGDGEPYVANVNQVLSVVKTTDENKKQIVSYYDRSNNLVKQKDSDNEFLRYEYNILGKPTLITNKLGIKTYNSYDSLGRLIQTINPDYGNLKIFYDNNNNLIKKEYRKYVSSVAEQSQLNSNSNILSTYSTTGGCPSYGFPVYLAISSNPSDLSATIEDNSIPLQLGNTPVPLTNVGSVCHSGYYTVKLFEPSYTNLISLSGFELDVFVSGSAYSFIDHSYILNHQTSYSSLLMTGQFKNYITSPAVYIDNNLITNSFTADCGSSCGNKLSRFYLIGIPAGNHLVKLDYGSGIIETTMNLQISNGAYVRNSIYQYAPYSNTGQGHVLITLPEDDYVIIDEISTYKAKGSSALIINLPVGLHKFSLESNPNSVFANVNVIENQVQSINLDTSNPVPGSLHIITNVDNEGGALVKLNGIEKGLTPITINDLAVSSYNLELSKTGYETLTKSNVNINSNSVTNLALDLVPSAEITNYEYDGINRMKKVVLPDEPNIAYTYDNCSPYMNSMFDAQGSENSKGRLCRVTNGYITKEFIYDDRGRITAELFQIGTKKLFNVYSYDSADNLNSLTDPAGKTVIYTYNSLNQIDSINANGRIFNLEYNPEGTLNNIEYPNSIVNTYTYNNRNMMETLKIEKSNSPVPYLYEKLSYDDSGNIKFIEDLSSNSQVKPKTEFVYDSLYRLTNVLNANNPELIGGKYYNAYKYEYDLLGNRLKENNNQYYYSENNQNKLNKVSNTPYNTLITDISYDNHGNIKSKTYNKEVQICNIGYNVGQNGVKYIILAFDDSVPIDSRLRIIYEKNVYDDRNNLNLQSNHYEWLTALVKPNSNQNIACNDKQATRIAIITNAMPFYNLQPQRSDELASQNSWYDSSKMLQNFKAYNNERVTDNYIYNSLNQLKIIRHSNGLCSNYFYDENGLRIKKIENNKATLYIYSENNPIYEESYSEPASCGYETSTFSVSSQDNFASINGGVACSFEQSGETFVTITNTGSKTSRALPVAELSYYDQDMQKLGSGFLTISPSYYDLTPGESTTISIILTGITGQAPYNKLKVSVNNGNSIESDYFICQ